MQAERRWREHRPLGTDAVAYLVETFEAVTDDLDEGALDVPAVEPNSADESTPRCGR
jgi:hypothetical protein